MHHISRSLALFGTGCSPHSLVPKRCKFSTSLGLWRKVIPPLLISLINSPHLQLLINLWMILTSFPSSWLVLDEYDSLVTSIQTCVYPLSLSLSLSWWALWAFPCPLITTRTESTINWISKNQPFYWISLLQMLILPINSSNGGGCGIVTLVFLYQLVATLPPHNETIEGEGVVIEIFNPTIVLYVTCAISPTILLWRATTGLITHIQLSLLKCLLK